MTILEYNPVISHPHKNLHTTSIIAGCIYWTRTQSRVRRILKVYKENARVPVMNMCSIYIQQ